jgi:hypothetical protein
VFHQPLEATGGATETSKTGRERPAGPRRISDRRLFGIQRKIYVAVHYWTRAFRSEM